MVRPLADRFDGVVTAHGICPRFSDLDTYHMTANAIDEALRNYVSVGGNIDHVAGLDNFCWCDPVKSEKTPDGEYKAAQLVRSNQALYEYCLAFGVPLISGKDSMKNDYHIGDTKISIPPTLLFSVIGKIDDIRRATTMDAKCAGDLVYLSRSDRRMNSAAQNITRCTASWAPTYRRSMRKAPCCATAPSMQHRQQGLIASCHDLSDGGLAVALAETAFAGGFGIDASLAQDRCPSGAERCNTAFLRIRQPSAGHRQAGASGQHSRPCLPVKAVGRIGEVTASNDLRITGVSDEPLAICLYRRSESGLAGAAEGDVTMAKTVKAVVIAGNGTNCEREVATACELAGAECDIVHIAELLAGRATSRRLSFS